MKNEDRQLLLQDLCVRLPYKIRASYYGAEEECETWDEVESITTDGYVDIGQYSLPIECIKPYLFPLSSMTEEQIKEALSTKHKIILSSGKVMYLDSLNTFEFYNKNHFDYRGLIPKGLAIDAIGLNIY